MEIVVPKEIQLAPCSFYDRDEEDHKEEGNIKERERSKSHPEKSEDLKAPGKLLTIAGGEVRDKSAPIMITASIALSIALLVFNIQYMDGPVNPNSHSLNLEPIIEWLPDILAIACAYNALWMLAYYCTGKSSHYGGSSIVYLLKSRGLYGPYVFLAWIFAAYFILLIIKSFSNFSPLIIKSYSGIFSLLSSLKP